MLYTQATPTPSAMSVNMLRLRVTTERQPRTKNGQPPQRTTGVARRNSVHDSAVSGKSRASRPPPGRYAPIAMARTGSVRTALTQNRRRMSTSSGFSSSARVTVLGSSPMPQIGQLPGSLRTTSGCIGHTYSTVESGTTGVTRSSAMPQSGQSPGPSFRTSGCMGQVYSVPVSTALPP